MHIEYQILERHTTDGFWLHNNYMTCIQYTSISLIRGRGYYCFSLLVCVGLLFEGGIYFLGKPVDIRQWLDKVRTNDTLSDKVRMNDTLLDC